MKCSFCGKDQTEVHKLIAANEKTAICDECVFGCLETLVYPDEDAIEIDLTEDSDEISNSGC